MHKYIGGKLSVVIFVSLVLMFRIQAQTEPPTYEPDMPAVSNTENSASSVFGPCARLFPLGNKKLCIEYTDTVFPGDAVFVRFNIKGTSLEKAGVELRSPADNKALLSAQAYEVSREHKTAGAEKQYVVLLPLSSWYEPGTFTLSLSYQLRAKDEVTLILPITMRAKEFVSETIQLDGRNTAIKTDTSSERKQQIERLNEILNAIDYSAVYHRGIFVLPVTQKRRTAFFADRRIYTYTNGKSSTGLHYGVDFGVPTGTPVFSCGRGKVVLAEKRVSTGYSVVIEHLPGLYSLYYHLSSFTVKEGEIVERGRQIGLSGATGLATGPHLHWEVRLLGKAVNPDLFIENFPIDE